MADNKAPSFQNQFTNKQSVLPQKPGFLQQPIDGLRVPTISNMNWGNNISAANYSTGALNTESATNTAMNSFGTKEIDTGNFGLDYKSPNLGTGVKPPDKLGAWTKGAGMAVDVAQVGLGIYNAMEQSKMNKFMKSYYGDQMDLMKADYTNNARSANQALSWQRQQIDSAAGINPNSAEGQKMNADYMAQWGAKETV